MPEAGEVAEGRRAGTEVSAADEEVTSGLGIFFQFKTCHKTQVGIFCSDCKLPASIPVV